MTVRGAGFLMSQDDVDEPGAMAKRLVALERVSAKAAPWSRVGQSLTTIPSRTPNPNNTLLDATIPLRRC